MKDQKGITLVALIVTIVVMVILASISITTGMESLDSTRLQGFYTQLEMIQKRVDDIATTNEGYIDSNGNLLYIKEQGKALTASQKTSLQNIMQKEEINLPADNFKYFTAEDLQNVLDLLDLEYNVFIDFENRVVIAEEGIKISDKTYYVLENKTYFVEQNTVDKNKGTIQSLSYNITRYGDKYKVLITPSNSIGDVKGTGYVKYKKTTTKYWETSNNTEIVVEQDVKYNLIYQDNNQNSIEKIIEVNLNADNEPVMKEQ